MQKAAGGQSVTAGSAGSAGPRVALVVAGSRGDAQPFIALALALAAAGARPILMTHAEHAGLAAAHGVAFRELPGDPREMLATRAGLALLGTRDPVRVLTRLRGLAADLFDDVIEALERELADVDMVVYSTLAVAAHHVAEWLGLPRTWGVLQPVTPTRAWPSLLVAPGGDLGPANLASHHLANALAWRLLGGPSDRYRKSRGLPPLGGPRDLARSGLPVLGGWSAQLAPAPPDWPAEVRVTGAWALPGRVPAVGGGAARDDAPLPPEIEEYLAAGAPPIYFGLGSATVADPRAVGAMAVAAARDAGVRLVLSRGWAALGDGLAARDVLVVDEVDHAALFPRCAAVAHHAGAGTTHTALAAGVPAVPLPFWGDQPFWAARSHALGVASRPVPARSWHRGALARSMAQAVWEPWRRERAAAVARRMAAEAGAAGAAAAVLGG